MRAFSERVSVGIVDRAQLPIDHDGTFDREPTLKSQPSFWLKPGGDDPCVTGQGRSVAQAEPSQHRVTEHGDDAVLRIHSRAGALLRSAPVPSGSYNVQHGFGTILTPSLSQGTLCVLSERGARMELSHVARSSHDACFVMA